LCVTAAGIDGLLIRDTLKGIGDQSIHGGDGAAPGHSEATHVRDIEEPGLGPYGVVFCDQTAELEWELPLAKCDEASAE
jgi:hypothetical protein